MNAEQLKIIFKQGTLSAGLALQGIQAVLTRHNVPLADFALYDEPMALPSVLPQLERLKRKTFNLAGQRFELLLGSVGNYHLDFLEVKSKAPPIFWDEWVAGFMNNPNFVMAWVVDSEYDYWQNAEDPLQYTSVGKPYAHLPMKSNGLPYPVEKKILDTSGNPGRWRFRDGYIEAVGAVMWLGEPFWALTATDRNQVENTRWLRISHPTPSVTKIQGAEHCFTAADGTGGELQSKLRYLLFPAQAASP